MDQLGHHQLLKIGIRLRWRLDLIHPDTWVRCGTGGIIRGNKERLLIRRVHYKIMTDSLEYGEVGWSGGGQRGRSRFIWFDLMLWGGVSRSGHYQTDCLRLDEVRHVIKGSSMMSLAFIPHFSLSDLPDFLSAARYWASSFIYLQDARQGEEKEGRGGLSYYQVLLPSWTL